MAFQAFFPVARCIAAAIPAGDNGFGGFQRVACPAFIILMGEMAFHVAMHTALSSIFIDGEAVITDQHSAFGFVRNSKMGGLAFFILRFCILYFTFQISTGLQT